MEQLRLTLECLQKKNEELEKEIQDRKCHIKELQHHIELLESDLMEAQDNKIQLPHEPIRVAEMLIYATETYETSSLAKRFGAGDTATYKLYSNADLRQIAEHLFVYCNNSEDDD